MGRRLKFKNGNKEDLPKLLHGEIAYCNDTKEYYVGTPDGSIIFDNFDLLAKGIYIERRGLNCFIGIPPENRNEI